MTPEALELTWRAVCLRRLVWLAGALALTIFSPGRSFAVTQNYEGRPISSIAFDPPALTLDPHDRERAISGLKVGQPLRMAQVRKTIEQLYDTGRFDDI